MNRIILHSDLNNFYASVECLYRPELAKSPVAVGGDSSKRHGIILAKNELAKKYGVKTAEPIWQAQKKCPGLVIVPPDYKKYSYFSREVYKIYKEYTSRVEPFGLDECWLDISLLTKTFSGGRQIADEIREKIRFAFGLTVSVGVSFNKVFAKLGSDLKKPDATSVIADTDYKEIVWPLPAADLLYIGRSTLLGLQGCGINTIGDIANTSPDYLKRKFGKHGHTMWLYANGQDNSPVSAEREKPKSIGNSTTLPRDIKSISEALPTIYVLAEKVAARLCAENMLCTTIQLYVRDSSLFSFERQAVLSVATSGADTIAAKAIELLKNNYNWERDIRSIGIRCTHLTDEENAQLSFLPEHIKEARRSELEHTLENIRHKFGKGAVKRGRMLPPG